MMLEGEEDGADVGNRRFRNDEICFGIELGG
jgi:hypothetical protein